MANTTYLNIEIPDVGADNNTWGTILNAALNSFDACLRPTGNGTSIGLNVGSGNTLTVAGTGTVSGTWNVASGTLVLPAATVPAQTAEGSVVWDSNDDLLTVGTGSGRKTMVDTDSTQTLSNKSFAALVMPSATSPAQTAAGSLVWDSDDEVITVGNGSGRVTFVTTDTAQTVSSKTFSNCTAAGYFRAASGFAVDDVYSIGSVAAAGTIAVDVTSRSSFQTATVTGSTSTLTITGPSGRGVRGNLFVRNTSGGSHDITMGSGVYTVGAIPTVLLGNAATLCLSFVWDGTQAWVTDNYVNAGAVDDIYPPQSTAAGLPS